MSLLEHTLAELVAKVVDEALVRHTPRIVEAVVAELDRRMAVDMLTTEEAAAIARVQPRTIRKWVGRNLLSRHYAGSDLRIDRAELLAMLGRLPRGLPPEDPPGAERLTDDEINAAVQRLRGGSGG